MNTGRTEPVRWLWRMMIRMYPIWKDVRLRCAVDESAALPLIVELSVHDRAESESTVPYRTEYPGDAEGKGGVYNFVTKQGSDCKVANSKLFLDTSGDRISMITCKYPSCILTGDNSTAEFYNSVAVTNNLPARRIRVRR